MAEIVRMPKLSDTMTDGVVAAWHKKVGDKVESGDLLAEIETDKATMEFESFQDGVLLHIGVEAGAGAPVESVLAVLGEAGEDIKTILEEAESIELVSHDKGKFGRILGDLFIGSNETSVNQQMILDHHAVAYTGGN